MKKFLAVLLSSALIFGCITIYGASSNEGDKDGDICTNPWGEMFTTTEATTTEEPMTETSSVEDTTPDETTTVEPPVVETTTPEQSSVDETSTVDEQSSVDETTTVEPSVKETTTVVSVEESTTSEEEYIASMKKPRKVTIKKIAKKKLTAKIVKLTIKKVPGATGYEIAIYQSKKKANNDRKAVVTADSTKIKIKVKSKKLVNKKKLYVKVRAYVTLKSGTKVHGKWSKVKKIKVK